MAFCPKCGSKLNEGAAFCVTCGSPTGAAHATAPSQPSPAAPPPAAPAAPQAYSAGAASAPSLMTRVMNILMQPKQEWVAIAGESTSVSELFTGYIVILAAIPVVAGFISSAVIGSIFASVFRVGLTVSVVAAVLQYALSLGGVFVAAVIIEKLAPSFQSQGRTIDALKLVAYAYTAVWVAGVFALVPILGFLGLLAGGIYSIYLFYLGLPVIMKTPQDKVVAYMIVALIVTVVIYFCVMMVVGMITAASFIGARTLSY